MLKEIIEPLLDWYDANARVLPWREEPSPYRVWVSEIMLQQTRVKAVKPFFDRFLESIPGVKELAECPQDRLLKLWEGLGYYNRVRNMQNAARVVMEKYDGRMPENYEALLELPGIGRYTAGAISSIAFGIPVPAVDGNVLRVMSRLTMDEDDILKQSVKSRWEREIGVMMPQDRPGAFNQALMELGAVVCVPNGTAKCGQCPLEAFCMAREAGRIRDFPKKAPKKQRKIEKRTVLILLAGNRTAICKRPENGLLAGLYEPLNLKEHLSREQILNYLKERHISALHIQEAEESKHIFSHKEWHMAGYIVKVEEPLGRETDDIIFVEREERKKNYPIPSAFRAYMKYM
ncbi:A/G-specific adenine glycosylase [Anaerotruncus sp. 1XD22-93]|nr:A/G-specific adenine glycosylase [Lachnospiraceae bacterium]NBI75926.1 A/G-specific adenine glycosylase [Lachnospiraceae bacterium]RKJ88686.1 A/G-specific adenine glycosylase [Anaerotruncus sp. 1XD22-93]